MDTRVGYAATSVLERECLEYITAHIVEGKYVGQFEYLSKYEMLRKYNAN